MATDQLLLLRPDALNLTWSTGFVRDALGSGHRNKCFACVDDVTKERLTTMGFQAFLDSIMLFRGSTAAIRTGQGPEFSGRAPDQCAFEQGVELCLIQPDWPTQNAFIESFNGRFRDEYINEH